MKPNEWPINAIFIAAPRELSTKRFTQIVKHYLPKADIVLGIAREEYVDGFEGQVQFRMLRKSTVQPIIDKVASSNSLHKIYPFVYAQHELENIVKHLVPTQRLLLVNGSWRYAFHNLPAYKILKKNQVPIKFISPFADEIEAKQYELAYTPNVKLPDPGQLLSEKEMFAAAGLAATQSFDYSFQTGTALGVKREKGYEFIATTFNKVVPYQTHALHYGNSREKYLSPPHDTNHYDTIHAEMLLLVEAARGDYSLEGATLFINLLPCPNCARTLSQSNIAEVVYNNDHSDGYAIKLLEQSGKKVRRLVQ